VKLKTDLLENNEKEKLLSINELNSFLESISTTEEKKGFLFSETKLTNLNIKKDTLIASLTIQKSKKRNIDDLIINGYSKFSKKNIRRYLNIKNKEIINNEKLEEISENTKRLFFLSETKSPEILFKKDSTILYLYLKKEKNNSFDGILNFASKEDESGILFTGHLRIDLNNIFNSGANYNITWEANGEERQNFALSTTHSYLFNSPFTSEIKFKLHRQDSIFSNSSLNTVLRYNLNNKTSFGVSYDSENSQSTTENNIEEKILSFNNNFIGLNFNYSNLTKNQFKINLNPSIGYRNIDNIKTKQLKFSSNTSYYYKLNYKNAVFLKNETGFLISESEIKNEVYRIGGANSIRGFNEEEIFASKYSFINLEYHHYTSPKSYFYSISDFGFTNLNSTTEKLLGVGLGYSFLSKNNQIDLSAVTNMRKDNLFNLNNSKIIIKLVAFF